jgi:glycine C-acetyltransferase
MKDLFDRIAQNMGPLGMYQNMAHGYYSFPKLEGEIDSNMKFHDKKHLIWSLNNYLGLANHPEIRKIDAAAAAQFGMAYPMGSRMMSGDSIFHEELEKKLANFVGKENAIVLNYGYQGIMSAIDALVIRHDVIVYDIEAHASIIDGIRLHSGKHYVYLHNDMASLEKQLEHAKKWVKNTGGSILVITEGVFGMSGDQGKLNEIISLKCKFQFRLFVDDAHGFGTMGETGAGTHEAQNCISGVDIYFATFTKSMAGFGAFIASNDVIINFLRYNIRSQIFAKALSMPMVLGLMKRLELIISKPELRENLWFVAKTLQKGLKDRGFNIGITNTMVTPVYLRGNLDEATEIVKDLRENHKIFCSLVIYPVVPKGVFMLRLIPTALHTISDINRTLDAFDDVSNKLFGGCYNK